MSSKILITLGAFVILVFVWLWGYGAGQTHPETIVETSIVYKDSIRVDSIFIENRTIETKIIKIENECAEKISTINNSSDSLNYIFFSEYLDHYNNQ